MMLFGIGASRNQALRVADRLGIELALHEEREFEDSEFKIRSLESVRGHDVLVYHSLHADRDDSACDKLCRLLFFIGALRDASAASVHSLVPYLAFARKDRRTKAHDPITTRYVAQMFEAVGIDGIATAEVHNQSAFENAFRCPKLNLTAAGLFAEALSPLVADEEKIVVVSPDVGGVKRARAFASLLAETSGRAVDLAFVEKHRSEGIVSGDLFAGDVADAFVIVIDDLISGGTTIARAAKLCREKGAHTVHAAATHGLFAEDCAAVLGTPDVDSIVVTDTCGDVLSRVPGIADKLVVLDTAEVFADAARRMIE